MDREALIKKFEGILGPEGVISGREQLRTYERDSLAGYAAVPKLAVLPETAQQVQKVVKVCHDEGVPFVARGSGTGLSGGALPLEEGILIVLSRMRRILEVDIPNRRVVVEPGVINLWVTQEVAEAGYYYAPDPSSGPVSSIGGNVAENAGGVHCLKYGFTTNHVTGLEVVLPGGSMVHFGGKAPDPLGYDLLGAFVGSEGTLGIATKITLNVVREPETSRTLLAAFPSVEGAGGVVSGIIAAGVLPAAAEIMDPLSIEAVEEAVHPGYPEGAVLILDLDGPGGEVEHRLREVERICRENGAIEVRVASDADESALIWKGRKAQFAAMARLGHDCYVQDSVVPRTALAEVLRRIADLSDEWGLKVANASHAGDGNLHPMILYDGRVEGEADRAHELAGEILLACLAHGGSITGEHGVGEDKKKYMPKMFSEEDTNVMQLSGAPSTRTGSATPARSSQPHACAGRSPVPTACTPSRKPVSRRCSRVARPCSGT